MRVPCLRYTVGLSQVEYPALRMRGSRSLGPVFITSEQSCPRTCEDAYGTLRRGTAFTSPDCFDGRLWQGPASAWAVASKRSARCAGLSHIKDGSPNLLYEGVRQPRLGRQDLGGTCDCAGRLPWPMRPQPRPGARDQ